MDGWVDGWMNGWMDGWMASMLRAQFTQYCSFFLSLRDSRWLVLLLDVRMDTRSSFITVLYEEFIGGSITRTVLIQATHSYIMSLYECSTVIIIRRGGRTFIIDHNATRCHNQQDSIEARDVLLNPFHHIFSMLLTYQPYHRLGIIVGCSVCNRDVACDR